VQQGTPLELLTQPATPFVRDFFGRSELGIKLLSLASVGERTRRGETAEGEPVLASISLREALSIFVARHTERLPVIDDNQRLIGVLHFADLVAEREAL
jgi:osmoprotectant transport system ATP-binding protein